MHSNLVTTDKNITVSMSKRLNVTSPVTSLWYMRVTGSINFISTLYGTEYRTVTFAEIFNVVIAQEIGRVSLLSQLVFRTRDVRILHNLRAW